MMAQNGSGSGRGSDGASPEVDLVVSEPERDTTTPRDDEEGERMRQPRLNAVDRRGARVASDTPTELAPDEPGTTPRRRTHESVAALQARITEELARRSHDTRDGVSIPVVEPSDGNIDRDDATADDASSVAPAGQSAPSAVQVEDDVVFAKDGQFAPRQRPAEGVRIVEAILFAATEPVSAERLLSELPIGTDLTAVMAELEQDYAGRGVALVRVAGKWAFRTANDLGWLLEKHACEERRLSRAAQETLAIISYHQPVTPAEIEEIRGVATSKGTLDVLLETGWIRPRGRRRAPGKPITYGTTDAFLEHFGLESIKDLPGLAELKGAGLLDSNLPPDFKVPEPTDVAKLMPDELPLEDEPEPEQSELELDDDATSPEDDEVDPEMDDAVADGSRKSDAPSKV